MKITAGIVILNYNTYDDTKNCIASIDRYEVGGQHRIYIVDNASFDGSGEKLRAEFGSREDVTYLCSEKNLGFSGGNNIGIRQALQDGCEYIFCLNSDILLMNEAISHMVESFRKHPQVAVVCPRVYDATGEVDCTTVGRPITFGSYLAEKPVIGSMVRAFSRGRIPEIEQPDASSDYVGEGMACGCIFAMTADFARESGCLDENVFLYYEESILAYKMSRFDKKLCICANAHVIHIGQTATNRAQSKQKKKAQTTRLYARTSAIYVLRSYAQTNAAICYILAAGNILLWAVLSIFRSDYRVLLKKFMYETKRVLRAAEH